MAENSGPHWVARFPGDNSLAGLVEPFRDKAVRFVKAMRDAGMTVTISTVFRPTERAYLMFWAWKIAREGHALSGIPPQPGVDINWNWSGGRAAAEQMVEGYGIVFGPAFPTHHSSRLAIDMTIEWTGQPTIVKGDGTHETIATSPKDGGHNAELWKVGASYGVIKLVEDHPHWSADGH
jgi:hypothetical protein